MRIYEGSPRQDFEEVFRSIGAFLDQRGMKDILLVEAPDGFIVQGLVVSGQSGAGTWSESMGTQVKETLTFLDDDIARFMEEAAARRGRADPMPSHDAGRERLAELTGREPFSSSVVTDHRQGGVKIRWNETGCVVHWGKL